ncbi:MAG: hypothetical protein H0U77_11095 [Nocardioidaceae bacterium]|nr:hypothetical protein [Nocardioidaceae bacterium]
MTPDATDGDVADPLPPPTPRQLVVRSIGTALVLALLVVGLVIVLDARDEPADVRDLVEEPRTVSYGRVSLQIPADWVPLNNVDECGYVLDDTLILGNAGLQTCENGERDDEASDVVVSALRGRLAVPVPPVDLASYRLPSGLRGEIGSTVVPSARPSGDQSEDEEPLITTVLQLPTLDAQVLLTSRDQALVDRIIETVQPVPSGPDATTTVAYLSAAIDVPRTWTVNDIACGVPRSDTVVGGYAGPPRLTSVEGRPCPPSRPRGVTDIVLDSVGSDYSQRWSVLATEPVTLLGGIRAARGTKQLPDGVTVTVTVVPDLAAIAVARSSNQALVDTVLTTLHRAVPPQPDEEQTAPTPTPEPSPRPTLPAGVDTRRVTYQGITLFVPTTWSRDGPRCPTADTIALGATSGPPCLAERPEGVSDIVIDRLYGEYGSRWQAAATEPITLASGLFALQGRLPSDEGLPVTVTALPSLDVVVVATAADDGPALNLIDGILATIRPAPREG